MTKTIKMVYCDCCGKEIVDCAMKDDRLDLARIRVNLCVKRFYVGNDEHNRSTEPDFAIKSNIDLCSECNSKYRNIVDDFRESVKDLFKNNKEVNFIDYYDKHQDEDK